MFKVMTYNVSCVILIVMMMYQVRTTQWLDLIRELKICLPVTVCDIIINPLLFLCIFSVMQGQQCQIPIRCEIVLLALLDDFTEMDHCNQLCLSV